jgi:hypothetical protein
MRRCAVSGVVLAALAFAGCGGSSTSEDPPPRTTKPSSNQNPDATMGAP